MDRLPPMSLDVYLVLGVLKNQIAIGDNLVLIVIVAEYTI